MFAQDLISDQGLRLDGRRSTELRRIQCKLGVFSQPDGSAYFEQGNTKVLAAVYGPHQVMHSAVRKYIFYTACILGIIKEKQSRRGGR